MDSSPPPAAPSRKKLRPWYLVVTMLMTWFVGVHGLTTGCSAASFLRQGNVPDVQAIADSARDAPEPEKGVYAVLSAATLKAMSEAPRTVFPLAVAKLLLSGLLIVASGLALGGRRGARALALQALAANVLLAGVEYALTTQVRAAAIDTVARLGDFLPVPHAAEVTVLLSREWLWWFARVQLAMPVAALTLGALALTRPRTKSYFDAMARATERADEP